MADISKITVPINGTDTELNFKDSAARTSLSNKMDKANPTGTGSLSLNRKSGSTVGTNSVAEGRNGTASGNFCHVEGDGSTASGVSSHAEGDETTASGNYGAHSEGRKTTASGNQSHAEGSYTIANHRAQHVFGENNIADTSTATADSRGNYVEIVGNGASSANRSNARTLDWNGNETLAGDLKINGNQSLSKLWTVLSGLTALSEKSGSIASFSTDISDKLFSCYVNVTAVQAGSGTPSPTNVRAISGWSACNLVVCGVNLFDGRQKMGYISTSTGQDSADTTGKQWRNIGYITVRPNTEYYMKLAKNYTTSNSNITVYYYDANHNFISAEQNKGDRVITTPSNCSFFRFCNFFVTAIQTAPTENALNYPSTVTTYQPYNGTTHTIPFGQTVYGGVLDVLSGVLTVTHGMVDLGTLSYTKNNHQSLGIYYYANVESLGIKRQSAYTEAFNNICEQYAVVGRNAVDFVDFTLTFDGIPTSVTQLQIKNSNCADATAMQTALNGVKLVFELATPTVIQLTPTEVKTILGQNNIFADCGDIDLKYLETIGNRL